MTVSATESTGGMLAGVNGASAPSTNNMDKDTFLQLLVAQLRYQDPMNPTDSTQFLAQSAQFTALEKMQDVSDRVGALLGSQMAFGAGAMVGQSVSWIDTDGVTTHAGVVAGVTFGAQGPVLDIDGSQVPLAQLLSVGATTAPAAPDPTDTTTTA